ncbi:MAG: c-type cytochrome [Novosphingobium sp.]|uniref:c-type cytochrome n=1 Tax=Novosphingobium sp. TaxID=1874826 RepID=UPI0032BAA58E
MADRFNTIAGWTLGAGIVALGLSSISGHYFGAGQHHRPEKMGYKIDGVIEEGEGGVEAEPLEAYLAKADLAKGEASFKKCAACHTATQGGAAGIGPNLFGIVGKGIGAGGFAYSDGLKGKGGKWEFASMNAWLTSPSAFATGTKMSFAGISDPQERANVIVYLNSQGSNLPLPAVPEKKEEAAPAASEDASAAAKPK